MLNNNLKENFGARAKSMEVKGLTLHANLVTGTEVKPEKY